MDDNLLVVAKKVHFRLPKLEAFGLEPFLKRRSFPHFPVLVILLSLPAHCLPEVYLCSRINTKYHSVDGMVYLFLPILGEICCLFLVYCNLLFVVCYCC